MTSSPSDAAPDPTGSSRLRSTAAWALLPERTAVTVTGRDAVRFLDGFTTAAVSRLAAGQGTEGFFTDARGWVLALANLLRTDAGLWIDAAPGLGRLLTEHLEHYHIREQVTFDDVSAARASLLVAGPRAAEWLATRGGFTLPENLLAHAPIVCGGVDTTVVRSDWYGPGGLVLHVARSEIGRLAAWLTGAGLPEAAAEALATLRIENGSPEPIDIPAKCLPQELGREARAISFTKGCYLGQETVARLDALGHVNRRFVGVVVEGSDEVQPPADVSMAGETVGTITSACFSPRLGKTLGLALILERGLAAATQGRLDVGGARAGLVPLPLGASVGEESSAAGGSTPGKRTSGETV